MARDSALAILTSPNETAAPAGAGAGVQRNVWRIASYLTAGRMVEVIWYSPGDEHRTANDTVPEGLVVPVVVVDGVVRGVGRKAHLAASAEFGISKDKY